MVENDYAATAEDREEVVSLSGISVDNVWRNSSGEYCYIPRSSISDKEIKQLLREMGEIAFSSDADAFAMFVEQNKQRIRDAAFVSDNVTSMLIMGYKIGISAGSGACMNDLGALYYMGDLVDQDYAKATELYEMAMEHGCFQSIVNLGYIWEYGRTGEKNYAKAFEYYALAASLGCSSEATYKLGDMYARGKSVERDMDKTFHLWCRSLDLAQGIVEVAQPALRVAQFLISDDCEETHVEPDALHALHLFQQAEIGLHIDIADGQTYYAKRLQEAIEGQKKARAILDTCVFDGD